MPSAASNNINPTDPSIELALISTSDTVDLVKVCRAIYVGGGGNINILAAGDSAPVLLSNASAGTILPIRAKRVYATSTTATLLVALY